MFRRYNIQLIVRVLSLMGIWGAFLAIGTAGADDTRGVMMIRDGMRPVVVDDGIMEIDLNRGKFTTNRETTIKIGRYKENNEVKSTRFLNADDKEVDSGYLKRSQRVLVSGYRVSRFTIFAKSVQVLGQYMEKEHRTIRKLSPIKMP